MRARSAGRPQPPGSAIEEATAGDVDALAALHLRAALEAYAHIFPSGAPKPVADDLARAWARELASPAATVFVAREGGVVVGGVVASTDDRTRGMGNLRRLYVDPDRWGVGTGRALHDAAVACLTAARVRLPSLWVLEGNERARRMYERWGWRLVPGDRFEHTGVAVAEVRYTLDRRVLAARGVAARRSARR
jgi:GNAT superfamily N-acetyltransferase